MRRNPRLEDLTGTEVDVVSLPSQWNRKRKPDFSERIMTSSPDQSPFKEHLVDESTYMHDICALDEQCPVWLQMISLQSSVSDQQNRQHFRSIENRRYAVLRNLCRWPRIQYAQSADSERDQLLCDLIHRNMHMDHPNIISTYGVVLNHKQPMIVCQWMPGGSLASVLDQVCPLLFFKVTQQTLLNPSLVGSFSSISEL